MERYMVLEELGSGAYGSVWKAINRENGELVAIKKLKRSYQSWEECINLREVKSLRKINDPNIVKLKEVINEFNVLYLVFEYMDCNLYELMSNRGKPFSVAQVKHMCLQVFQGLATVHCKGYIHRDMKPENLLVSNDVIKIADFGFAREINSQPPFTHYVSTRWYRAPEVMLQSSTYGPSVDMWAMGAIMFELLTHRPLFPGSSEADQMYKICRVLGSPTKNEWPEGLDLAAATGYQFPQVVGIDFSSLLPGVSVDAIDLITSLCSWDPCRRPTATRALFHPFFESCFYIPPSIRNEIPVSRLDHARSDQVMGQHVVGCYELSLPELVDCFNNVTLQPSLESADYTESTDRAERWENQLMDRSVSLDMNCAEWQNHRDLIERLLPGLLNFEEDL